MCWFRGGSGWHSGGSIDMEMIGGVSGKDSTGRSFRNKGDGTVVALSVRVVGGCIFSKVGGKAIKLNCEVSVGGRLERERDGGTSGGI